MPRETCLSSDSVERQLQQISYASSLQSFFTAMADPPEEVGDPHKVWQVFKSVFKNLNSARAASQEKQYLTSLTKIVSEFPQALVATSTWPDLGDKGRKREAVTSALVRCLIHCQAVQASSTMAATVELLNLVLSVLHRHSLTRFGIVVKARAFFFHIFLSGGGC